MLHLYKQVLTKEDGFSLTELLVVLVIIGVLVMLAIPIYNNIATRAKITEAKLMLNQVHTLQESFHMQYDHYSEDLHRIGFQQERLITENGRARYIIDIEYAAQQKYTATATSIVDYNNNGVFNVWEINEDGILMERTPD
ncbi:prepilin-type N-terminal cleavage/methylation domain-containing protein [soil metagenome]